MFERPLPVEPAGTSTGSLANELDQPDQRNVNIGEKPDSLGIPKGQVKQEDENVKKIEDKFQSVDRSALNNSQQQNTSTPQEAVVRPQVRPAAPPPEPTVTPKPRPRKSLTGALDRIRSSIDDFNDTTQGAR